MSCKATHNWQHGKRVKSYHPNVDQRIVEHCSCYLIVCVFVDHSLGMPCAQCAHSAKFWMSTNTRTLVSAPFHKFLVPY